MMGSEGRGKESMGEGEAPPNPGSLRILTFNVGLLRLRLCGIQVWSNPPHANLRLQEIPGAIRQLRPDIVCLQECYEKPHLDFLTGALSDILPHVARCPAGGSGGFLSTRFHNALAVLSRFEVTGARFEAYEQASALERLLASKGQLVADLAFPGNESGSLRVVNLHTTAGGAADPEHPGTDNIRQSEIQQAFQAADEAHARGVPCVIVGDLNAGPEASPDNYQSVLDGGFRDAWVEGQGAGGGGASGAGGCTWDPKNPLNAVGPHSHCPPQRCDHLFLPMASRFPRGHMDGWGVGEARLCLTESRVAVGGHARVTLSDHYGLLFELRP